MTPASASKTANAVTTFRQLDAPRDISHLLLTRAWTFAAIHSFSLAKEGMGSAKLTSELHRGHGDGHLIPPPRRRAQRDIYKLDERIGRILLKTDQRDPLEVLWNSSRFKDRSILSLLLSLQSCTVTLQAVTLARLAQDLFN